LKAALKEIEKGKSVAFNISAGAKILPDLAKVIGLSAADLKKAQDEWSWLTGHTSAKGYAARKRTFFHSLQSPLAEISSKFPKSQAKYWLKNTPPQVADLIYQAADAELPADELYVYAAKEGLIDYVRADLGLGTQDEPTKEQLKKVKTNKAVSGYSYLGTDHFMSELDAKREPLRSILPSSVDLSKVQEQKAINEKGSEVRSAKFPDLAMALAGFAAMMKRRRRLFKADA